MICTILILLFTVFVGAYMSFLERRLLALFQNRYGPNRVGWQGSLQVLADFLKILFKEDWIPPFSNRVVFVIAPVIAFVISLLSITIVPFTSIWMVVDIDIGILFFIMMSSLMVYAILLAGWASNNKYALIGAMRAAAQTLSYEIFLGLSLMGVVIKSGSFNLSNIVADQLYLWNIVPQFLGFVTFFIAGIALCHRHPFDQPESEQELADGYHIEYSGMKFSLFFVSEYISVFVISSLIVTLFLGGWQGPYLLPCIWFLSKTFLFVTLFILIRAALPRPRYDQVMLVGWKIILPITLINILGTSVAVLL